MELDDEGSTPSHEVARVINGAKKLVRYVKKTSLNKKIQEKGGKKCLIQENQTRWLSMHGMLNSIDRSYDVLVVILSEMGKLDMVTIINRKILKVRDISNRKY